MLLIAGAVLLAGCKKSGDNVGKTPAPQDTASGPQNFTTVEYFPTSNPPQM